MAAINFRDFIASFVLGEYKKKNLSNDINVINSQTIIWFICLFMLQAFFFFFVFFFLYFVKGNERLSHCRKRDEMLCLCVRFENSNLLRFKFKKKNAAFQIIVCLMSSIEYFDYRKNIRRNIEFVPQRRKFLSPVFHKLKNRNSNIYNVMIITFILTFIHNHLYIK